MRKQLLNNKGFTLVELLIVMVVIGILSSLIMVNFIGARERARDAARKGDLEQIKTALRLYYNDNQQYPPDNGSGDMGAVCGALENQACAWESEFSAGGTVYMKFLPNDPVSSLNYYYRQTDGGDGFRVITGLENESDSGIDSSQARCRPGLPILPLRYLVCED